VNEHHLAVVFDLDGLLIDTERMALRAFQHAGESLGVSLTRGVFEGLIGRTSAESASSLLAAFGADFPLEEYRQIVRAVMDEEIATRGIPVKKGVLALLEALERSGVPTAIATSSMRDRALFKLERTGLERRFGLVVAGDDVTRSKPAPDIFREAARRLDVPPERCVALEDSPIGIRAAAGAAMTAVMVPDLVAPDDVARSLAHAIVEDMEAARPLVSGLLGIGPRS
jgi:HAD superfamily hydrolase (TIGR01509 family)